MPRGRWTMVCAMFVLLAAAAASVASPASRVGRVTIPPKSSVTLDIESTKWGRMGRLTIADAQGSYTLIFSRNQLLELRDGVFDARNLLADLPDTRHMHIETIMQSMGKDRSVEVRLAKEDDGAWIHLIGIDYGAEATSVDVRANSEQLLKLKLLLEAGIRRLERPAQGRTSTP